MSSRKPKKKSGNRKPRGWTREAELAASDHDYFCKKTLINKRDWTETLVAQLLGEPDHYAPNPHGPRLPRMHQYARDRVLAAEETDTFRRRTRIAEELIAYAKMQPIELTPSLSRESIESDASAAGLLPLELMRQKHSRAAQIEEHLLSNGAAEILTAIAHERFLFELHNHYPWIENPLSPPTLVRPKQETAPQRRPPAV